MRNGVLANVLARVQGNLLLTSVLAVLATSPIARAAFVEALQRALRALARPLTIFRLSREPPVRKNFLCNKDSATPHSDVSRNGFVASETSVRPSPQLSVAAAHNSTRFADLAEVFPDWLATGLAEGNFEVLKPIQRKILPLALAGRDVVGIAPTGSGKTLAFLVPALVHAAGQTPPRGPADGPIALVLAPTRELAVQIGAVAEGLLRPSWEGKRGNGYSGKGYGKGSSSGVQGLSSAVLYGGPRRSDQLQSLRFQRQTHLVVATPGRLLDFVRNGAFGLRLVSFLVLDEGDRMLDYGFEEDVAAISAQIRSDRQMLFFSATWPAEVEHAARRLCGGGSDYERIEAGPIDRETDALRDGLTLPPREIRQIVEVVRSSGHGEWGGGDAMADKKLALLFKHLESALGDIGPGQPAGGKALIFVRTRQAAEEIGTAVSEYFGLGRCGVMHGLRKQDQREATLKAFRQGSIRALVATDVVGRGVDIPEVSHVVVYDFPDDLETYVHRVGRTGRNGRPGTSIAFFEPQHWYPDLPHELAEILRACGQEVPEALAVEENKYSRRYGSSQGAWDAYSPEVVAEVHPAWKPSEEEFTAPPLEEKGGVDVCSLATQHELGDWHAGGARVWGYSANSGVSEQGRVELRTGGVLRTTWGWGEWTLADSSDPVSSAGAALPASGLNVSSLIAVQGAPLPHCPPPTRPCPSAGLTEATQEVPKALPRAPQTLQLSWNGVEDVMALDSTGLAFELVSRNGRPAHTYRKKTLGRAIPGITL